MTCIRWMIDAQRDRPIYDENASRWNVRMSGSSCDLSSLRENQRVVVLDTRMLGTSGTRMYLMALISIRLLYYKNEVELFMNYNMIIFVGEDNSNHSSTRNIRLSTGAHWMRKWSSHRAPGGTSSNHFLMGFTGTSYSVSESSTHFTAVYDTYFLCPLMNIV